MLTSPIVLPEFTNEKKLSLKKLPTFREHVYGSLGSYGEIYLYNEKNELVFLYSDGKRNAIKYDLEKDMHRQIKSSQSIDVRGFALGLRMGIHWWIIGGTEYVSSIWGSTSEKVLKNTILWVQFFLQISLTMVFCYQNCLTYCEKKLFL